MDFLVSIPYIVLLLGGLIFFHELGHFVFARWMGVHVITFSIGFGPVLFRLRGRQRGDMPPTEYVISALPFGGFVRMLGADPTEVVDERLRHHAFESKAVWRRFLIMAAGPAFNLMLPYFIYMGLGLSTTEHLPSFVGTVSDDSPAASAGLRSGDTITAIDGEPVRYWWQIHKAISERPEERIDLDVLGVQGDARTLSVVPELVRHVHVPEVLVDEVGRVGITPDYLKPAVAVVPEGAAYRAGLRSGDVVKSVNGESILTLDSLFKALSTSPSGAIDLVVSRQQPTAAPATTPDSVWSEQTVTVQVPADEALPFRGIASLDCAIRAVEPGTRADALGLKAGDILLDLDGTPCRLFGFLMSRLRAAPDAQHQLVWSHGSEVKSATASSWLAVPPPKPGDETQLKAPIFGIATWSGLRESPELIPNEHTWTYAVTHALDATHRAMWMNVAAVAGLFRGRVPVQELSGPVGIAKLAAETTERGWGYFFGLMVWLSVSLGILNLLPIPVLDGGHIMFLAIEAVQRRPVSMRTRQVATYAGLAFIILLMVLVLKFDIERVMG